MRSQREFCCIEWYLGGDMSSEKFVSCSPIKDAAFALGPPQPGRVTGDMEAVGETEFGCDGEGIPREPGGK
jgi:hypothetical protein